MFFMLIPESLSVVSDMIDQVIELHPDIKWFHIGADEVYLQFKYN